MKTLYNLRVFTNIRGKCIADFESPVVPHVGESFYLAEDDKLYRINDVMYSDLNDLVTIDIIASVDNSYDALYESDETEVY